MHFRSTDCPLIFMEFVLHPQAYGQLDYYILQERDATSAFLSKKGLKQAHQFGSRLVNNDFSKRIIKSLEKLNRDLKDITLVRKIKNAQVKDLGNLYD